MGIASGGGNYLKSMSRESPYCGAVRSKYIDVDGNVVVVPSCGPDRKTDTDPEATQTEPVTPTPPQQPQEAPPPSIPETAGGVRKACLDALARDVESGGDSAKGICTPWEYEQVSKMNVEGVEDVKGTTDNLGEDIKSVDSILTGDFGLSTYMKFWTDVAGGNETIGTALSLGAPALLAVALFAMYRRTR